MAQVIAVVKMAGLDGIGFLVLVVEIPDATLNLKIMASMRPGSRKTTVIEHIGIGFIPQNGLILEHEAVGTVRQADDCVAGQLQLEVGGDGERFGNQIVLFRHGQGDLTSPAVDALLDCRGIIVDPVAIKCVLKHIHSSLAAYFLR